jgi:hypothetical protein
MKPTGFSQIPVDKITWLENRLTAVWILREVGAGHFYGMPTSQPYGIPEHPEQGGYMPGPMRLLQNVPVDLG